MTGEQFYNEEPCGKPQGIINHITTLLPKVTLWQATGNSQVKETILTICSSKQTIYISTFQKGMIYGDGVLIMRKIQFFALFRTARNFSL